MIARQNQTAGRPDQPRQLIKHRWREDAPRRVSALWPRVGKQHIGAGKTGRRHAVKDQAHIIIPDTDVGKTLLLDMAKQAGDAIDEGLGANEAGIRTRRCDRGKVLPAAKADLEKDIDWLIIKLRWWRLCRVIPQLWEPLIKQPLHDAAKLPPFPAPVEMRPG